MGTHPIFESDFDCLTEKKMLRALKTSLMSVRRKPTKFRAKGATIVRPEKLADVTNSAQIRVAEKKIKQSGTKTQLCPEQQQFYTVATILHHLRTHNPIVLVFVSMT